MPRRPRLKLPGVPVHIIQRGHNRAACFFARADYLHYLHHLQHLCENEGVWLHAYVLMTNHVHLLVTPREAESASQLMKHLGQRYVQYINRTYRRSGTLWEGRFRSCLAEKNRGQTTFLTHSPTPCWGLYPARQPVESWGQTRTFLRNTGHS